MEAVIAANEAFYGALSARSITQMAAVWEHSERATCVHPGLPILRGWDAIEASFERMFSDQHAFQILLTNASVVLAGDTAWVVLDEDLVSESGTTTIAALNVFCRHDDQWLMVAHHGSRLLHPT